MATTREAIDDLHNSNGQEEPIGFVEFGSGVEVLMKRLHGLSIHDDPESAFELLNETEQLLLEHGDSVDPLLLNALEDCYNAIQSEFYQKTYLPIIKKLNETRYKEDTDETEKQRIKAEIERLEAPNEKAREYKGRFKRKVDEIVLSEPTTSGFLEKEAFFTERQKGIDELVEQIETCLNSSVDIDQRRETMSELRASLPDFFQAFQIDLDIEALTQIDIENMEERDIGKVKKTLKQAKRELKLLKNRLKEAERRMWFYKRSILQEVRKGLGLSHEEVEDRRAKQDVYDRFMVGKNPFPLMFAAIMPATVGNASPTLGLTATLGMWIGNSVASEWGVMKDNFDNRRFKELIVDLLKGMFFRQDKEDPRKKQSRDLVELAPGKTNSQLIEEVINR